MAGKSSCAHKVALLDIWRGQNEQTKTKLINEIRQAIREKSYSAIILDEDWFKRDIEKYYKRKGPVFNNKTAFWPVTGLRKRPEFIYVPRKR